MTIVAWDGKALAVDRAATDGAVMWESIKAWYHDDGAARVVLSGVGPLSTILLMRDWFTAGADPAQFPTAQLGHDWCHFLVATQGGLHRYEQAPIPIPCVQPMQAFGEGKDFALGALAMGATAEQAVLITNTFSVVCGVGVDGYVP